MCGSDANSHLDGSANGANPHRDERRDATGSERTEVSVYGRSTGARPRRVGFHTYQMFPGAPSTSRRRTGKTSVRRRTAWTGRASQSVGMIREITQVLTSESVWCSILWAAEWGRARAHAASCRSPLPYPNSALATTSRVAYDLCDEFRYSFTAELQFHRARENACLHRELERVLPGFSKAGTV